ncbi:MAG: hypothetical protein Q7Q71_08760 [Verrucomicrobiota bacterium JB023]|nr:hypothetical protein [Verrucomicrobiota bacterium JB023]
MAQTPYLTDFSLTVSANAKRQRQAGIRLRRDELAGISERKAHVLMRLHQARFSKLDCRKRKKITSFGCLVTW